MLKQALVQMGEITVRVSCRGRALVDLDQMHALPRNLLADQETQHDPRSVTAANRRDEPAAHGNGRPGLCRDQRGRLSGDRIGIDQYFDVHGYTYDPGWLVTIGLCRPSDGETLRSTSPGPQVPG